jgi:hypothetical protein
VAQAIRLPPRTTYQLPAPLGQAASSASRVKPMSPRVAAAVAQAWYGDGDASQNASSLRAASRSGTELGTRSGSG